MSDAKRCGKLTHGVNCAEPVIETLKVPTPRTGMFNREDGTPYDASTLPPFAEAQGWSQ